MIEDRVEYRPYHDPEARPLTAPDAPTAGDTTNPADIEEDAFLAGPDRHAQWLDRQDGELLDIDWIFGKELGRVLAEISAYDRMALDPVAGEPESPSLEAAGYSFRQVDAGVLLVAPDGSIAGAYLGCDLAVAGPHRGQGLGAELVLERYLRDGDLPTWHLDTAAYSPEGEAAHRAGWRLLQNHDVLSRKLADIGLKRPD